MKYPKFRRGDIVKTKYGTRATILRWFKDSFGRDRYVIKYTGNGAEVELNESDLEFYNDDLKISPKSKDYGSKCPKCSTPWTTTYIGAKKYYDCIPCKKKAEDICSYFGVHKEKMDEAYAPLDEKDLLAEFEAMLNDNGDDWDDWF